MMKVINDNDSLVVNPKEVLAEQAKFYKKLYTSNPRTEFSMSVPPEAKLNEKEKETCERDLTMEELGTALKETQRNKTPGPDGIPADVYQFFWSKIKFILYDAFVYAFKVRRLHPSARRGVISLIPKQARNLLFLKNWRPICLLDACYKLLSKVILNRIKIHLDKIISRDQSRFLKGRHISENIRKAIDTISYAEKHKINGLLISIDFTKAFDMVQYNSLYAALKNFGFGTKCIEWMKLLFTDFQLCTQNNGFALRYFVPTRGCFQGNPISSYAFLTIIELLATLLRANKKIEGLSIRDVKLLLSMFADDMDIFICNKASEWRAVQQTIQSFEHISGMKVNYEKSVVYRLGSARKTNAKFFSMGKLIWSDKMINVLGISVSDNPEQMLKDNLDPLYQKADNILKLWQQRHLSLFGKIQVLNSLINSLFIYRLTVLPIMTAEYIKKYETMIRNVLWNKGISKIPLNILYGRKQDGGAGLLNLIKQDKALKMQWIVRIQNNETLKQLAYDLMENPIGDLIWQVNIQPRDLNGLVNSFGLEVDFLALSYLGTLK